jgi:hypothetical protein
VRFTKKAKTERRGDRPEKKKPQAGKSKKKSKISVEKKFQITNKIP